MKRVDFDEFWDLVHEQRESVKKHIISVLKPEGMTEELFLKHLPAIMIDIASPYSGKIFTGRDVGVLFDEEGDTDETLET